MFYNLDASNANFIFSYNPSTTIDTTYDLEVDIGYSTLTAGDTCSLVSLYGTSHTFATPGITCTVDSTTHKLVLTKTNLKSTEASSNMWVLG
jgi:hypothetical protein